jgi:hypothetical protein
VRTVSPRWVFAALAVALPMLVAESAQAGGGRRGGKRCGPIYHCAPVYCCPPIVSYAPSHCCTTIHGSPYAYTYAAAPARVNCPVIISNPAVPPDVFAGSDACFQFQINSASNVENAIINFYQNGVRVGYLFDPQPMYQNRILVVDGTVNSVGWGIGTGLADIRLTVTYTGNNPVPLAPVYANAVMYHP